MVNVRKCFRVERSNMREIKFRAWLKDEKKMIDVKAIDFDENGDVFSVNYPEGKAYSGYDADNIELM